MEVSLIRRGSMVLAKLCQYLPSSAMLPRGFYIPPQRRVRSMSLLRTCLIFSLLIFSETCFHALLCILHFVLLSLLSRYLPCSPFTCSCSVLHLPQAYPNPHGPISPIRSCRVSWGTFSLFGLTFFGVWFLWLDHRCYPSCLTAKVNRNDLLPVGIE